MAALAGGTRLGPYEILAPIGAGGMGEVYRGRDTRLDRVVAIKVLAAGLATDITSRERFDREARAISSLNHPNICVLHDVGRERPSGAEAPVDFLVMEFLEGDTLAARLSRGRAAKTLQETLSMAIAIAAALDCAHRQGIVHRDLKPGNVMLLANGAVKLLDFGLARLSQAGAESAGKEHAGMVSLSDLSQPTVSSPLTVKGTILGTLQYMAPEQLEGKPVDARADIFAFGGMLYEMLTGKRPFEGKSQASLIGAILDHQPPPVSSLQPLTPPILDDIVARCLEKNPDDRWQSARDLKRQLEWVAGRPQDSSGAVAGAMPPAGRRSRFLGLQLAAAVLAGAIITAAAAAWLMRPTLPPPVTTRFVIQLPEDQAFTRPGRHLLSLSPDGSQLVYVANQQLYLRPMNTLTASPIRGTEGTNPGEAVFSPDGQWIAFWSDNAVKKVPVSGGSLITLCTTANPLGMSWSGDRIVIGSQAPRGVVAVPSSGGQPETLVALDEKLGEYAQSPSLIADGRAVLFSLRTSPDAWDVGPIVVQELESGRRKVIVTAGTDPTLLSTGHVVFTRRAALFAVPFDPVRLEVTGAEVPVLEGIRQAPPAASGAAQWVWSRSGSVAFIPGEESVTDRALTWIDRKGGEERTPAPFRRYEFGGVGMRISPDGSQVALVIVSETTVAKGVKTGSDIWIWHMARNTLSRLTVTTLATSPVWTADSRRVCYRSETTVFCQAADGTGQPARMFSSPELAALKAVDRTAHYFLLNTTSGDIALATLGARPEEVQPLIKTAFNEGNAVLSPDGRWVAYSSNESGIGQVYVRPFPAVDAGRWQVSSAGGFEPRWSRDGKELFFLIGGAGRSEFWRVAVRAGATFDFEPPTQVARFINDPSNAYDIGADGRFLVHRPAGTPVGTTDGIREIVVIHNWREELLARVRNTAK